MMSIWVKPSPFETMYSIYLCVMGCLNHLVYGLHLVGWHCYMTGYDMAEQSLCYLQTATLSYQLKAFRKAVGNLLLFFTLLLTARNHTPPPLTTHLSANYLYSDYHTKHSYASPSYL